MNKRYSYILKTLKGSEDYITSQKLSALINVSSKTIRKDIHYLNNEMKHSANYIDVIPSKGMKLVINDIDSYKKLACSFQYSSDNVIEREEWITKYLIEENTWIKSEDLCERLFISQSTLSQNLKAVRNFIEKFDLSLSQKPRYGIRIEGREFNKRLCLTQLYMQSIDQREDFPGSGFNEEQTKLIQAISELTNRLLTTFQISMSTVSVQSFIIDVFVLLQRVQEGYLLLSSDEMVLDIAKWTDTIPALELARMINERFSVFLKDQEIVSLSIHLASKRIIRQPDESIHQILKNFNTNILVKEMLSNIKEYWSIDLFSDAQLSSQLALHLIPLEVRARYSITLRNPMLQEIKKENMLAYQMAYIACRDMTDYHGNALREDEIGYIALHLNLALLRKQINEKKNVLVVSGLGRGTSHTLAYQIQERYGKYIHEIKTADPIELDNYDLSGIDLLISSIPLNREYTASIIVNYFLNPTDLHLIEHALIDQKIFHVTDYINEDSCYFHISASTKEEILSFIRNAIPSTKIMDYELNDDIVMISLTEKHHTKDQICIFVLNRPILWNDSRIQFVLCPLLQNETNTCIIDLYKELSVFTNDPAYMKRILKKQNYQELNSIFQEITI